MDTNGSHWFWLNDVYGINHNVHYRNLIDDYYLIKKSTWQNVLEW